MKSDFSCHDEFDTMSIFECKFESERLIHFQGLITNAHLKYILKIYCFKFLVFNTCLEQNNFGLKNVTILKNVFNNCFKIEY